MVTPPQIPSQNEVMGLYKAPSITFDKSLWTDTAGTTNFYTCPEGRVLLISDCQVSADAATTTIRVLDSTGAVTLSIINLALPGTGSITQSFPQGYVIYPGQILQLNGAGGQCLVNAKEVPY